MQRLNQNAIDLKQGLAARQHDEAMIAWPFPGALDRGGKIVRRGVAAAVRAIHAHEIGVAETAGRGRPILLAARPEIATGEAAEHSRAAGLSPLALQRLEDLLDGIAHATAFATLLRRLPLDRSIGLRELHVTLCRAPEHLEILLGDVTQLH